MQKIKAPASSYALMTLVGLGSAAALGAGAGWLRETGGWWLNFAVFTAATAGPCLSLAWATLVAPHMEKPDPHAEDNVEARWTERATSGAFLDLIVGAGILLAAASILDIEISGSAVLSGVIVLGALDASVRYLLARGRGA
ncbi:hypothetical protein ERC79_12400 [Rhodococcus sp. ABRD24]|uniref:hypothetical protein n=1 Tax=Rhodococcus sp. ABRD24 TaxID=2507582 RepID=UPI00103FE7E8|nr:hypothetical protein [Rhodococcus sp. ABRD24]QBJ96681.1 hypothetical protein ERC79_12400 [Rhodococcus sp. ABRD24]